MPGDSFDRALRLIHEERRELRNDPDYPKVGSWMAVDHDPAIISGILSGSIVSPTPTLIEVGSNHHLLYEGLIHSLAGPSGVGKSLFAAQCAIETMNHMFMGQVLWVDFEMNYTNTLLRLHALGWDLNDLDRFMYINPMKPHNDVDIEMLCELVQNRPHAPTLVVVDSVGEALNLDGRDSNTEEVSRWFATVGRQLANAGASVLLIDHTPKAGSTEFAIGSQRKRAAVDVQFMLKEGDPFSTELPGYSTTLVSKDRFGHFNSTSSIKMTVMVNPTRVFFKYQISATVNADGTTRFVYVMQEVSDLLEDKGPMLRSAIEKEVKRKATHTRAAVNQLVDEQYLVPEDPSNKRSKLRLVKPYSLANDPNLHVVAADDVQEMLDESKKE